MWKTKLLAFLLLTVFTVDLGAIPDAENRKAARDARRQERKEKREARKAKPEEVNLQDVVVTQASPQETAPVSEESIPEDVALNNVVLAEEVVEEPYYEETTTTASAVEPKTTSSKEDKSPAVGEQSPAETEESEEDNSWIGVLIIAVVLLVSFVSWLNSRRCPRCRKRFAMVAIDENFHGFGKENGKTCNKMKVTRQCKYCGFQDYVVEKRQFDK
jgi:hypothetical protein